MVNLLAFPGLGTVLAAKKIGYAQAAVMLVGFFTATGYMCWIIYIQIKLLFDMGTSAQEFGEKRFEHWWIGVVGFALCLIAWIWSLFSSIQLLKENPKDTPLATVPPGLP